MARDTNERAAQQSGAPFSLPAWLSTLSEPPPIVQAGARVLRHRAESVPSSLLATPALRDLVQVMTEVMRRAPGVGLAAPQIGINRKIVIFRNKGFDEEHWSRKERDYDLLINPRITQTRGEPVKGAEGCLSCPEVQVEVYRFPEIKVRAYDIKGNRISKRYEDFLARIAQHEIDHLDGRLIVDYEGPIYFPKEKKSFFERIFAKIT